MSMEGGTLRRREISHIIRIDLITNFFQSLHNESFSRTFGKFCRQMIRGFKYERFKSSCWEKSKERENCPKISLQKTKYWTGLSVELFLQYNYSMFLRNRRKDSLNLVMSVASKEEQFVYDTWETDKEGSLLMSRLRLSITGQCIHMWTREEIGFVRVKHCTRSGVLTILLEKRSYYQKFFLFLYTIRSCSGGNVW